MADVSDEVWASVDAHLLRGERVQAIALLREANRMPMADAIGLMVARLDHLRESAPGSFVIPEEEWGEFYS